MISLTESFLLPTRGKGTYEITGENGALVQRSGITMGLATIFLQHTSASLAIYENS